MITLSERAEPGDTDGDLPQLTLNCQQRTHSRLRATLDDGRDVGVLLERGTSLTPGDILASEDGLRVRVAAAAELISECRCDDQLLFARACYHLGNRHVPLQIQHGHLAYSHDHVLDDMLRGLGLTVTQTTAPFEPEAGAYGGGHQHAH